jgi:hypothetical protein
VLESLGLKTLQPAPLHRLEDGINVVRVLLPKCWTREDGLYAGVPMSERNLMVVVWLSVGRQQRSSYEPE